VTTQLAFAIFEVLLGGVFAVHCPLAARREWREGVARGRYGDYLRGEDPFRFWITIAGTAAAGLLGLLFLFIGAATIADVLGFSL
jgi:hypothetical protein